ncbi:tumor necrosis factor ligand superfamily member 10 [Erinaceus europaeus]|uniref:Tumor necrosis factor ligand superfamily member n=1 Tax=Erinaceus europaeus TaxID=9365 RepID=A0A0U5EMC6_ERIEU|nr:tumor necrosis factor ligand superfamily member 10 [Erinaceus europaeus]ASA48026.1 TRAIL protein [Erinaceus europaeus]CTQ86264.1 TPA: tumor necrosis factor ligand 6A [Erinaceus europaeus]
MASVQALGGPSPGQSCVLILIIVLLQSLCMAVAYIYFTNELKQMQNKYAKSSLACFLIDSDSWDASDGEDLNSPCWHVKWELRQFVRKMILRTSEENATTNPEKLQNSHLIESRSNLKRVAAHITGTRSRRTTFSPSISKDEKTFGQKINSWESSRKGHSFLSNVHLRNGELVIHAAGLYYIYSQTYFRFQEPEDRLGKASARESQQKNKQMVQYIYKSTNYPEPILLMKSARNSCWSKDSEYGLYSIYQGGVFELKENDKIFVSVTNQQLIDMDEEASFFGVFLID